jgi:RHS repeat-associated protein
MGMSRNGQIFLFATDQLGSIFSVADSLGNSVQEILYDSFGRRIQNSNPEYDLILGFGGGLYDSDTGLIHYGYREYDPVIGRFISPDPLGYDGGDVDVYGVCLDDPVNFVDRLGLSDTSEAQGEDKDEGTEPEKENENFFWTVIPKKMPAKNVRHSKEKLLRKSPKNRTPTAALLIP